MGEQDGLDLLGWSVEDLVRLGQGKAGSGEQYLDISVRCCLESALQVRCYS